MYINVLTAMLHTVRAIACVVHGSKSSHFKHGKLYAICTLRPSL